MQQIAAGKLDCDDADEHNWVHAKLCELSRKCEAVSDKIHTADSMLHFHIGIATSDAVQEGWHIWQQHGDGFVLDTDCTHDQKLHNNYIIHPICLASILMSRDSL